MHSYRPCSQLVNKMSASAFLLQPIIRWNIDGHHLNFGPFGVSLKMLGGIQGRELPVRREEERHQRLPHPRQGDQVRAEPHPLPSPHQGRVSSLSPALVPMRVAPTFRLCCPLRRRHANDVERLVRGRIGVTTHVSPTLTISPSVQVSVLVRTLSALVCAAAFSICPRHACGESHHQPKHQFFHFVFHFLYSCS